MEFKNGEFQFGLWGGDTNSGFWWKTVEVDGVQIKIKMKKNKKKNSLKHWATGLRTLGQLRVSRVLSSRWEG